MKIIELLQKIANGEEVPKKIRYDGRDMFWCEPCKIYEVAEEGELCGKDLYNILDNLNDKVEIIEEDKKIEKLSYYDYSKIMASNDKLKTMELMIEKHEKRINDSWEKINKIIDYINNKD